MPVSNQLVGQKVGDYEVIKSIGMGGMGAVYEGKHPIIGKRVAIKVLLPQFSEDEGAIKRFFDEARAVNEIGHRGIVDIFSLGQLPDGAHYLVMEYLDGTSFEGLLKQRGTLPPVEALGLLEEVLEAVGAAHRAKIIHRDLKPSNIFLVDGGSGRPYVKLLDFGVAKLAADADGVSKATGLIGTPLYMAPEQVEGKRASAATDIYSLGVVLFELLTGRPPFEALSPMEMMNRHLEAIPPRVSQLRPGLPPEIDRLVERMLAKKPQDRPQDAEELRAELANIRARLESPRRSSKEMSSADESATRLRPSIRNTGEKLGADLPVVPTDAAIPVHRDPRGSDFKKFGVQDVGPTVPMRQSAPVPPPPTQAQLEMRKKMSQTAPTLPAEDLETDLERPAPKKASRSGSQPTTDLKTALMEPGAKLPPSNAPLPTAHGLEPRKNSMALVYVLAAVGGALIVALVMALMG
jgi:serine/threonine protein kinase